ncbi:MAG: lipoate--protein ligase family protein [Gemmataceae bacterium]|nr:lipoate--protein ligase family protein [Gemmataceae bacterium]
MHRTIRLLPFAAADGPTNMADDEVMLDSAADAGVASLRFYTWTGPTLSLGYFQPAAARAGVPGLADLPWVRRATGGAAIVHHHELTYALALPAGKEWQGAEPWACRFHHLVRDVLAGAGVKARAVVCGEEQKLGEVLCFLHQTAGDLLIDGSKVAGSAQRKRRGALLQHGSILLGRSEFAPSVPGIDDLAGRGVSTPGELAGRLAAALAADLECEVIPADWTPAELARVPAVRAGVYANRAWNEKR